MASGGMHLIKDLPGLFIMLLPVKDVPVSLTLACSCSARCISSTVLTLQRLPLLHFLSLFAGFSSFVFRGDTAHTSSSMGQVKPHKFSFQPLKEQAAVFKALTLRRTTWTGVAIVTALTTVRGKYYKLLWLTRVLICSSFLISDPCPHATLG